MKGIPGLKEYFAKLLGAKKGFSGDLLEKAVDYVSGKETPEENPDKLLEEKGKDLFFYDVMMKDDRIKMAIELKKKLILAPGGDFVAASEDKKDVELKEFASDVFYGMNVSKHMRKGQRWWDVLDNLLDGMIYGFKVGEKVMDQFQTGRWIGKIRVRKIRFRHSEFFDFLYDKGGDLETVRYGWRYGVNTDIKGKQIDNKLIIFVWPYVKDGNFYGESDLTEVYNQWYAKFYIWRYRNKYLQGYGQPIPLAMYDVDRTSQAERDAMSTFLKNFQDNQHLMIPAVRNMETGKLEGKFEIDWRDASTSRGTDVHEKSLDQIDKQITRKLLIADKIGFSEAKFGNESFGKAQFDLLIAIIKDALDRLEDVINEMIRWLIDLNFGPQENYPEWHFETVDKTIEAEILGILIDKGIVDKREKWIRKYMKVPELSEKEKKEIEEEKEKDRANMPVPPAPGAPTAPGGGKVPPGGGKPGQEPTATPPGKGGKPAKMARVSGAPDNAATQKKLAKNEADALREYLEVHASISADLVRQVSRKGIVEGKDRNALRSLRAKKTELKKLLSLFYARTYFEGKVSVIDDLEGRLDKAEEAKKEGFSRSSLAVLEGEEWLSREWIEKWLQEYGSLANLTTADREYLKELRQRAFTVTGDIEDRMLKDVRNTLEEGWRSGLPAKNIIDSVEESLTEDRKKYAKTIVRTNEADAYNNGRMNMFQSDEIRPFVEAYLYNIVDDEDNSQYCETHKNQWIKPGNPLFAAWNPPNHFQCRSEYLPILVGESEDSGSYFYQYETRFKPFGTGVPVAVRTPQKGFGGTGK